MGKKYGFDIDGTFTYFDKFIYDNAVEYMRKKYQLEVINPKGYDVDEMFEIVDTLISRGYSLEDAQKESHKIMSDFWNKFYLKYALLTPFRKGVKELIDEIHKNGDEVYIISSRKRTCETGIIGAVMRGSVRLQLLLNGVHYDELILCENDDEKLEKIKEKGIDIMYDDKPYIMERLPENVDLKCINNSYNQEGTFTRKAERIDNYCDELSRLRKKNGTLKGATIISNERTDFKKQMEKTERAYKILKTIAKPFISLCFEPIVLNAENAKIESPVVVVPNHRETLDPFAIITTNNLSVHWGALKRFFDATDSIFNNSKNPILCKLTSKLFTMIGAVPVDRDNPKSLDSIKFIKYLRENGVIGIFPESSTNKVLEKKYGKFRLTKAINTEDGAYNVDKGAFRLAQKYNAPLLPVSVVWIPKELGLKNKMVINYREPIKLPEKCDVDELIDMWLTSINNGIRENVALIEKLSQGNFISEPTSEQTVSDQKRLVKVYKAN